jgi:hypothetical protein
MSDDVRFSQIYITQGTPVTDNERMRNRLGAYTWEFHHSERAAIVNRIHKVTGAKVPVIVSTFSLPTFMETAAIRDVLDSITIIFKYFSIESVNKYQAIKWCDFVSNVFKEENLSYSMNKLGGVRFHQDLEFERNRVTTISNLDGQTAVKEAFDKAYDFLNHEKQDTASAIRAIFEAIEIFYKHLVKAEGKERLSAYNINKTLKPVLQEHLSSKPVELKATMHILDGLSDWIDSGHMYRHGQKLDETEKPSIEFTVMYISQGASYLRFLLTLSK